MREEGEGGGNGSDSSRGSCRCFFALQVSHLPVKEAMRIHATTTTVCRHNPPPLEAYFRPSAAASVGRPALTWAVVVRSPVSPAGQVAGAAHAIRPEGADAASKAPSPRWSRIARWRCSSARRAPEQRGVRPRTGQIVAKDNPDQTIPLNYIVFTISKIIVDPNQKGSSPTDG